MRKGITPVIATVLLLMLAVGAVGGAFAFVQGMNENVRNQINKRQKTDTSVNSINCYVDRGGTEGVIQVDIQNSGKTKLDLDPVDINVKMPNGDINYTLSHRGVSLAPGSLSNNIAIIRQGGSNSWPNPNSYAVYQFNASARLEANVPYEISITLNDMGHEILTNCQAS